MLEGYVVRQQDISSTADRIAIREGLFGAQLGRGRAH